MPDTQRNKTESQKLSSKALRILGFVFVLPLIPITVSVISLPLARCGSIILLLVAVFAFFRPQALPLMRTRLGATGLAYLALVGAISGFSEKSDVELQALKESSPNEYLEYVQEREGDERYLAELSELKPEEHQAEIKKREAEEAAREAQRIAEREKRENERAAARQQVLDEKVSNYVAQINREIDGFSDFNPREYTDSQTSLGVGLGLLTAMTKIYEEGEDLPLTSEQEALRQQFKAKLIQTQKKALPIFRDAYGPVMLKDLWEHDASARTFGSNFTTVEFVAGMFAANRNIKQFQESVSNSLHQLRFKQARYKWYKEDDEYTYYTLDTFSDDELIIWLDNGRYRKVQ